MPIISVAMVIYEIWLTNVCPEEAPSATPYHAPVSSGMSFAQLSILEAIL